MTEDKAIVLEPELISFDAVQVTNPVTGEPQHILKIQVHTPNLGQFTIPATPVQAERLAVSLFSYSEQIAEYERERAEHV
ncbi:MAG: hypothetical protein CK431_10000 [Mycobacterium sp.]|nr:MAG: hypothetical protein CK431_10000 [Mycobacterium sp.]